MARSWRLFAAIAVAVMLAVPASASAIEVYTNPDSDAEMFVQAEPGEENVVHMRLCCVHGGNPSGDIVAYDYTRTPTAYSPCFIDDGPGSPDAAHCPASGISSIVIDLGDRNDFVDMDSPVLRNMPNLAGVYRAFGGNGADQMIGSPDEQQIYGGGGNDSLNGLAGADYINGGLGRDRLIGGKGTDKLNAKDGKADTKIDCGPGNDFNARRDPVDPKPISC